MVEEWQGDYVAEEWQTGCMREAVPSVGLMEKWQREFAVLVWQSVGKLEEWYDDNADKELH